MELGSTRWQMVSSGIMYQAHSICPIQKVKSKYISKNDPNRKSYGPNVHFLDRKSVIQIWIFFINFTEEFFCLNILYIFFMFKLEIKNLKCIIQRLFVQCPYEQSKKKQNYTKQYNTVFFHVKFVYLLFIILFLNYCDRIFCEKPYGSILHTFLKYLVFWIWISPL